MAQNAITQDLITDMYLFPVKRTDDSIWLENGIYLNSFNERGYNNQCSFFERSLVYFSSNFESNSTDIYALDLRNNSFWKVTDTEEAEYSPERIPQSESFSVVRIEKDSITQSMWKYPIDQSNSGERILPNIGNIGYYEWLNGNTVALFLVDDPNRLVLANIRTNELEILAENIGRCLKTNKEGELFFIQINEQGDKYLKKYTPARDKLSLIIQCPGTSEDFELYGDLIVRAEGNFLKYISNEDKPAWKTMADLHEFGIDNISRITIENDKLILINQK